MRRSIRGGGRLTLGHHPIADDLRELGVAERAYASQTTVWQRLVLPAGVSLGVAQGHGGYGGSDQELGRYLVEADGAEVDLYRTFPDVSPVSGAWSVDAPGT